MNQSNKNQSNMNQSNKNQSNTNQENIVQSGANSRKPFSLPRVFTALTLVGVMLFPWLTLAKPGESDTLTGAFVTAERPDATKRGIATGEYMSAMGDYISDNLPGREYLIKTKNEISYRGFHVAPARHVVMGKEDVLFSRSTIDLWYQLTGPTTDETIETLTGKLVQVRDIMAEHGIDTMVYITPSKLRYYEDYVPDLYTKVCQPVDPLKHEVITPTEHAIRRLKRSIAAENIPIFDSIEWIDGHLDKAAGEDGATSQIGTEGKTAANACTIDGIPLFTKNSMHWSVVNGARVGAALSDFIYETYGYDEPILTVTANPVEEPVYPDSDLAGIMNMYSELEDNYYEAVVTAEPRKADAAESEAPNLPGVICRGGSFMGQSLATLIFNDGFESDFYMENTQRFKNQFTDLQMFSDYDELNLAQELKGKNLLILEVNEFSVDVFSFEFMDYVIEHEGELFPEEEGM